MKKILFLGGAGFIGSNLIRSLLNRTPNWEISVLEPTFANVNRLEGKNVQIFRGELSDIDFIQSIIETNKIDTVVHLVATIIPGSTFEDYKREYQQVIFPSIELMQFCARRKIKFVYFSSGGTIYGNRLDKTPFTEVEPMAPISYYGWSKQMMENSILYVHRTAGLKYLILRPSNPYGHGQNIHAQQGLIAVALGKILAGEPINVWGDGTNVRDYIYIDDLSEVFCQLIERDVHNTTLNIGSGNGASINDILEILKDIAEEKIQVVFQPARKVDVAHVILDTRQMHKYVNVSFTPLCKGIARFYKDVKRKLER